VILLLGSLELGTSRHRGLLFKALADDMGMTSSLVRGRGYGPAAARAVAAAAGPGGLGLLAGESSSSRQQQAPHQGAGRLHVPPGYEGLSAFVCVQVRGVQAGGFLNEGVSLTATAASKLPAASQHLAQVQQPVRARMCVDALCVCGMLSVCRCVVCRTT
jgi:hypothetical protein